MEDIHTIEMTDHDEEQMFLRDVVGDEHELLYLDSYLRDVFGGDGAGLMASLGGGLGVAEEESTI